MGYDYYEERRKQEQARIYQDKNGFILRENNEYSAYVSGNMDVDSSRRFKSNNPELVEIVQSGLKRNKELYGKRYCPCRLEHTDENICFCQEFKQQPVGSTCHCGIYIKTEQ